MALVNEHLLKLPENYLFTDIVKRVNSFKVTHPQARIIHLGIGDVTLPIPKACVEAMQKAAGELGKMKFSSATVPNRIRAISAIYCATTTASE